VATTNGDRPTIRLLASAETSPSVLFGLYDVLSTAGAVYAELVNGEPGAQLLDVKIAAETGQPFRCYGGMLVEPHASLAETPDVAIVCDMYTPVDTPPRGRYAAEIAWLKRIHAEGAIVCSVCSGSLVLAEAGMLDGEEASGHWAYHELFRTQYPKVRFRMDSILLFAGDGDRIITAGGSTSWQDLALYLIAKIGGRQAAVRTAKVHMFADHSDGQLPFAVIAPNRKHSDAVIGNCQAWISANYACENPVARMCAQSGLNPRTFSRRFMAATGYHPVEYVQTVRIEEAKELLESNAVKVDEVGRAVGYEDPTFFRRLFKRKAGVAPAAYRRKFSTIYPAKRAD